MGLSLTHTLQELATRTETSEQAGVSLVSFIKGGGCQRRLRSVCDHTHHMSTESSSWRLFQLFHDVLFVFMLTYSAHPKGESQGCGRVHDQAAWKIQTKSACEAGLRPYQTM